MAVKLDMSDDEARLIWCQLQMARDGMHRVLTDPELSDESKSGYVLREASKFFQWIDVNLTKLAAAAPDDVRPTGNETDKPGYP